MDPEPGIHCSRDGERRRVEVDAGRLYLVRGELYDVDSPEDRGGYLASKGLKTVRVRTLVQDKETKKQVSFYE